MALWILRACFFLFSIGLGVSLVSSASSYPLSESVDGESRLLVYTVFAAFVLGAVITILADILVRNKRIDMISSVYFGLIVGFLLTYIVNTALTPLFGALPATGPGGTSATQIRGWVVSFLGCAICYSCISLLWQTRDDFRFVIPYVEFSKDIKGLKPYVLDTSVVIDGRIADVIETGIIENAMVMPRFILSELQSIADSSDRMRRAKGRRGLEILEKMRKNENIDLKIYDRELPEMAGHPVDMKLLMLARHLEGKVVTGDYNLNKVARLQNVPVINLNEIANSLKPVFLPGESIKVRIVKQGEAADQGVGYLDDGTMIVVEGASGSVGSEVEMTVTSMLQTNAGRMVFGKME